MLELILPISCGPYRLELIEEGPEEGGAFGARLRFTGLERFGGSPDRASITIETGIYLGEPSARLEPAMRAWARVVREVFEHAAGWPLDTERWLGPVPIVNGSHLVKLMKKKSLKTEDAFAQAWRDLMRDLLPPPAELFTAATEIERCLAQNPTLASTPRAEILSAPSFDGKFTQISGNDIRVCLQLIMRGEDGTIDSIKEQEVVIAGKGALSPPRVAAYLEAWSDALVLLFQRETTNLETMMPHDLVVRVLEQARPTTKEQMLAAFAKRWHLDLAAPARPGPEALRL